MIDIKKMTALERADLYELAEKSLYDKALWAQLGKIADSSISTLLDVYSIQRAIYTSMGKVEQRQFDKYTRMAALHMGRFDWRSYRLALGADVR